MIASGTYHGQLIKWMILVLMSYIAEIMFDYHIQKDSVVGNDYMIR